MRYFFFCLFFSILTTDAIARPLLSDSQKSHISACLSRSENADHLVKVCGYALGQVSESTPEWMDLSSVLADTLHRLGEDARAEAIFKDVLLQNPNHVEALNGLGWLAHDARDMEKAETYFAASTTSRPNPQGLAGHASALRHLKQVDRDTFVTMIDAALALAPQYTWAAREKSWGLMNPFSDMLAAEEAARDALEIDPEDVHSLYLLGYLLNELERYDEAFEHLNVAADLPGATTDIFEQRSLASYGNGYYKFALKDAERVIADWPEDPSGYVRRARALEALGERQEGIETLRAFVQKTHDDFALYWLAELYSSNEDAPNAIATLNRTIAEGEPDFYTYQLLSYLYLEIDQLEDAVLHARLARDIDPGKSYPYLYEAMVRAEEGEFDAAETIMKSALDRGLPSHSVRWFLERLMSKGEFVRAIQLRLEYKEQGALDQ